MADDPAATAPPATVDDWTRVDAGTFHAFHQTFVPQLALTLSDGLLPDGFYVHPERSYGSITAAESEGDLLTLDDGTAVVAPGRSWGGGTAVLEAPPAVAEETDLTENLESGYYAARASRLAVRRGIDHRIVALLEVASPGNKDRDSSVERLTGKITEALEDGVHVALIDLLPPGPADPAGLHGVVLRHFGHDYTPPAGKPLCVAGYRAGQNRRAYADPLGVGDPLPNVPLFLSPDRYVPLPLGPSYRRAKIVLGTFWADVLEGRRPPQT